ncbi:MAG: hypothetical protein QM758_01975 [Armatimonas sp.]
MRAAHCQEPRLPGPCLPLLASYSPPNHSDLTFGKWTPWWSAPGGGFDDDFGGFGGLRGGFGRRPYRPGMPNNDGVKTFEGITDGGGIHRLHIDLDSVKPARPYSLSANATMMDVNRQAWAAGTSVLVHPSERYVGLRAKKLFVQKGQPLEIEFLTCDIDGKVAAGVPVNFVASRKEYKWDRGRYKEVTVEKQEWSGTSQQRQDHHTLHPEVGRTVDGTGNGSGYQRAPE